MYTQGSVVPAATIVAAGPGQEVTRSMLAATGAGVGTLFLVALGLVATGVGMRFAVARRPRENA